MSMVHAQAEACCDHIAHGLLCQANKWDVNKSGYEYVWKMQKGWACGRPVWEPSVEDASWGKIPSLSAASGLGEK